MSLLLLLVSAAWGQATWHVPGDAETLSKAVAYAASGDLIEVHGDEYVRLESDVLIAKDVTIRGTGAPPTLPRLEILLADVILEEVVVSGLQQADADLGTDYAVFVSGGSVTLERVTVEPGFGPGVVGLGAQLVLDETTVSGFSEPYRGVELAGGSLVVSGGTFGFNGGGAIAVVDADVTIDGATFEGNVADGGADVLVASSTRSHTLTVRDSSFTGGSTWLYGGGAIAAFDVATVVERSDFLGSSTFDVGGALLIVAEDGGGAATVVDSTFEGTSAELGAGAIGLGGITATVERTTFLTTDGGLLGGAIVAAGGALTVDEAEFDAFSAVAGGAIWAGDDPESGLYGTTVTVEDSVFHGEYGLYPVASGGALVFDGAEAVVLRSDIHGTSSTLVGGAIAASAASLVLEDVVISDASSFSGGAIYADGTDLNVRRSQLLRSVADEGGAILATGSALTLEDSVVWDGSTALGSTILYKGGTGLKVQRSHFCGNDAPSSAGLHVVGGSGESMTVAYNVFQDNAAIGSVLFYGGESQEVPASLLLEVRNNTFVGNGGSAVSLDGGTADVRNNILQGHPTGLTVRETVGEVGGGWNLWWDNDVDVDWPDGALPGEGAVFADALFQAYVPGDCTSDLYLAAGSPARDAGDPALTDLDGSRSDIGAYGGPEAGLDDADGDGWTADVDCDDGRPDVHPEALEVPYDGVDQDCDGADACDLDGDGFLAVACGGTDCADDDPQRHPDAADALDDGVDGDCDGIDGRSWLVGGSGCRTAPPPVGPGPLLLVLLLARRRRSS